MLQKLSTALILMLQKLSTALILMLRLLILMLRLLILMLHNARVHYNPNLPGTYPNHRLPQKGIL